MTVDDLIHAATDLATSVGPRSTLSALERVHRALDAIDARLWGGDDDDEELVVDLRDAREVLDELQPALTRAEVRIEDLRSVMQGR